MTKATTLTADANTRTYFSVFSAFLAGFSIPVSTALENIGAALLLIGLLLSPSLYHHIRETYKQPFSLAGIVLGLMLAIGTLWSSATPTEAWHFVIKMHPYYLILFFLATFMDDKVRNTLLLGFVIGTLLNVILSCIAAWGNIYILTALPNDWSMFRTHSYHNYFAGLLSIGLISALLNKNITGNSRWVAWGVVLLASYDILFLVSGRTGQIVYLIMLAVVLFFYKPRTSFSFTAIMAALGIFILPYISPAIQKSINTTQSNIEAYESGDSITPTGLRLEYYRNSLTLLQNKPIIGHGTGSFVTEYRKLTQIHEGHLATNNPHNDYLMLSIQLGFTGALLILSLMFTAAWQGRHLENAWRWTLYAMLIGMGIATLANSFFMDTITGVAFVLLTSALLNGPKKRQAT